MGCRWDCRRGGGERSKEEMEKINNIIGVVELEFKHSFFSLFDIYKNSFAGSRNSIGSTCWQDGDVKKKMGTLKISSHHFF